MPWFKVDDTFPHHAKVLAAGNAAIGLWTRAGAWSMQQLTDGHIPKHVARSLGSAAEARRLVEVGLWVESGDGYNFHEWGERQPSREAILAQRRADAERQTLSRDPELREAVRKRDGDECRYCGRLVRFNDRRGAGGGTYDHVIPDGGTTIDNLVVACRGCNSKKGRRTPEQAGMPLRPVGVTKSDLSQKSKLTSSPDPTRPDPTVIPSELPGLPARKRALPEDFKPSTKHVDLAASLGVDLRSEWPQFVDHHRSRGTTMKDWDAALRTWIRNAKKFNPGRLAPVGAVSDPAQLPPVEDSWMRRRS